MYRSPLLIRKKSKPSPPKNEEEDLDPLKALFGMNKDTLLKEKNHIYFYGDVTQENCLELNRRINEVNKELLKYAIEFDWEPPNIYLHINSSGGDLLAAFSTVDAIRNSRIPIISIVEGSAASAATVMSMVCHKRYITENSFMLIHQLSTGIYGKYEEIKDDYLNDTKFMERLYKLYRDHTKMNDAKIKTILSRDIWWDANECITNGLVDDIWNSPSILTNLLSKKEEKNVVKDVKNNKNVRNNKNNRNKKRF